MNTRNLITILTLALIALLGCSKDAPPAPAEDAPGKDVSATAPAPKASEIPPTKLKPGTSIDAPSGTPTFKFAVSIYTSWSTYLVADMLKDIDGREGKLGKFEQQENVDVVIETADYDATLSMYGGGSVDAVVMTNIDAVGPALSVPSVAILANSTSDGADAVIVPKTITDVDQLKGVTVHGLEATVSQYMFECALRAKGKDPAQFSYKNMPPDAASLAMIGKDPNVTAIAVWNPERINTLNKRSDTHAILDSTSCPDDIIDMLVMSQSALAKPGGEACARVLIRTYYAFNGYMNNPATRTQALLLLGEKITGVDDMGIMEDVVTQTKFYGTPDDGAAAFAEEKVAPTMARVTPFLKKHDVKTENLELGYSHGAQGNLIFDPSYMLAVK